MINDALKITVDLVFAPRKGKVQYDKAAISPFEVPGHEAQEIMWNYLTSL
jgi:hypothetical protein